MRVALAGVDRRGRALDLRDVELTPERVATMVRNPDDDRVACAPPQPVHERVGVLNRGVSVRVPTALAAAARSRGATTEHDEALREIEAELAEVEVPDVDLEAARARVAETAADVDRLQEEVARASGRVDALRDGGEPPEDAREQLRTATRELADAETAHHAARERLAAAEERAQVARDARERRLALRDERDNRQRAARRELVDAWAGSFRRALDALRVPAATAGPHEFAGPDWAAGCAVARIARPGAPLVVGSDVFADAARASAALDAPAVLVEV